MKDRETLRYFKLSRGSRLPSDAKCHKPYTYSTLHTTYTDYISWGRVQNGHRVTDRRPTSRIMARSLFMAISAVHDATGILGQQFPYSVDLGIAILVGTSNWASSCMCHDITSLCSVRSENIERAARWPGKEDRPRPSRETG